jgi:hypothetical protein
MFERPSEELNNDPLSEEGYPERCPICERINFTSPDDYCEHFWATVYDNEMIAGPFANDFERLWSTLDDTYQTTDDIHAHRLMEDLRQAGLAEIAEALLNSDKLWWLYRAPHKNVIDAEASLASGSGWNLYQEKAGWFEQTIQQMQRAAEIVSRI